MEINYVIGDATNPVGDDRKIIIHCCNSIGAWGKGFVLALSKKWKTPEDQYFALKDCFDFQEIPLGISQIIYVEENLWVANMIGQKGVSYIQGIPPIRYEAIKSCLKEVFEFAKKNKVSIHGPRFGAGLAGGEWNKIEEILSSFIEEYQIPVTIYDLES